MGFYSYLSETTGLIFSDKASIENYEFLSSIGILMDHNWLNCLCFGRNLIFKLLFLRENRVVFFLKGLILKLLTCVLFKILRSLPCCRTLLDQKCQIISSSWHAKSFKLIFFFKSAYFLSQSKCQLRAHYLRPTIFFHILLLLIADCEQQWKTFVAANSKQCFNIIVILFQLNCHPLFISPLNRLR